MPEDLSHYDQFTIEGIEESNIRVVAQAPLQRYVIDGMDTAQDDSYSVMKPVDMSNRTISLMLFCVIPLLFLLCMFIYIMEMVTIRVHDNNGLPEGMDQKQGRAKSRLKIITNGLPRNR